MYGKTTPFINSITSGQAKQQDLQKRAYRKPPAPSGAARSLSISAPTGWVASAISGPSGGGSGGGQPWGGASYAPSGEGGGGAAPSQEQLDAQRAGELRKVIGAKRNRLNQLFDTLLDDVDRVTTARRGELQKSYDQELTNSREGFTQKSDELVKTFAGRGLADSSYRIEGEANAATQFKRALDELGRQNQSALGELGQSAAEKRAAIGADRSSLAQINLDELKDDVSGLTQARNQITKMIIEAQRQRSSLDTPGGYRGTLNKISPAKGQAQALRAQLDALIQSNTPQVVKDAIASGLIGNYGGVDTDVWNQYYQNAQQQAPAPQATPAPQPAVA
jgi:hypothetical protein